MQQHGRVAQLWRYPVKSMGGERLERGRIGPAGVPGDRGWAVHDETAGRIGSAKHLPRLLLCEARYLDEPDGERVPHAEIRIPGAESLRTDDPDTARRLSEFLGRPVTLRPPSVGSASGRGPFFDAGPLHLLTTATIAELGRLTPDAVLDGRRFRPNVLVETAGGAEGFVELSWCGRPLRIGGARVDCLGPVTRCSMTSAEQPGLAGDPSILRAIVSGANRHLGIYAAPAEPGAVRIGDVVDLCEPGH